MYKLLAKNAENYAEFLNANLVCGDTLLFIVSVSYEFCQNVITSFQYSLRSKGEFSTLIWNGLEITGLSFFLDLCLLALASVRSFSNTLSLADKNSSLCLNTS